jgi:F0F1-type ATP synthase membrane subunit b/b'
MDLDVTLLIQMALLVLLMNTFGNWLFVPVLHVIEQRQHRIYGLAKEVAQLDKMSQADRLAHDRKLQAGRRQALLEREALRSAGRDEARRLLGVARARLAAEQAAVRAQIKADEQVLAAQLQQAVPELAQALAQKLTQTDKAA